MNTPSTTGSAEHMGCERRVVPTRLGVRARRCVVDGFRCRRVKRTGALFRSPLVGALLVQAVAILVVALNGCGPRYALEDRCAENDGVYDGNVLLRGTEFFDEDGVIFALVGDKSMQSCRKIDGFLTLRSSIPHLRDLDNLEEVSGIEMSGLSLPTQIFDEGEANERECNVLGRFPSLKRIETEIRDLGSRRCVEYAGFEALEYVGRNFRCGPNPEVGRSLKHVGWTASCGGEYRLLNLEYVGNLSGPASLPNLQHAGRIQVYNQDATVVDLSSLETVGPIDFPPLLIGTESELIIQSNTMVDEVLLPRLRSVEGDIVIRANRGDVSAESSMSEIVREELSDVQNTGRRLVCANGLVAGGDPCPGEDHCEDVNGAGSIYCCTADTWNECLNQ